MVVIKIPTPRRQFNLISKIPLLTSTRLDRKVTLRFFLSLMVLTWPEWLLLLLIPLSWLRIDVLPTELRWPLAGDLNRCPLMAFNWKSSWAALSRKWDAVAETADDEDPMAADVGKEGGSMNFVADRSVLQIANSILRRHLRGKKTKIDIIK